MTPSRLNWQACDRVHGAEGRPPLVLEAVRLNGQCLQYASAELRADRALVFEAVPVDGTWLQCASAELEADHVIVLESVRANCMYQQYAFAELSTDRAFLIEAEELHKYGLARLRRVPKADTINIYEIDSIMRRATQARGGSKYPGRACCNAITSHSRAASRSFDVVCDVRSDV